MKTKWQRTLIFIAFLLLFYVLEIFYIGPVDGINDDWGMYNILSGAYLGYPEPHVLFFLYPLSFLLCQLYKICSFIPWFGLFQHAVHIACLCVIYYRFLHMMHRQKQNRFSPSSFSIAEGLTLLCILFLIFDLNVLSEVQYTTTAGLCAAAAIFCFMTSRMRDSVGAFFLQNIPSLVFAWLSFSMRQNIFYLMLPIAGMIWLAKWIISYREQHAKIALKLLGFALMLLLGMGILWGIHQYAYRDSTWSDYMKINYYRERIGDFYSWPEYSACSEALSELGIDEQSYHYMKSSAPHVGYAMSVSDWESVHDVVKEYYSSQNHFFSNIRQMLAKSIMVFFYQDGMQPLNLCVGILLLTTLILIILKKNTSALLVYLLYFIGRSVSWGYVLYQGRFPKRITQPLIMIDFLVLLGILFGFRLLWHSEVARHPFLILGITFILSIASIYFTKKDVDTSYHTHKEAWNGLKDYCHAHPKNLYLWQTGTLEYYCDSPFSLSLDTYNNFLVTNSGVMNSPNTQKKLEMHGISDFGRDVAKSESVYFIFEAGTYHEEHPVIMYYRHTFNLLCNLTDTFQAGDVTYEVYRLSPKP